MFELPTLTLGPSGHFVSKQGYLLGTPAEPIQSICNPAVFDQLRDSYRINSYETNASRLSKLLEIEHPLLKQSEFDRYGEVLVSLTSTVTRQNADLNLGLLRGAYRPCVIVEVMTRKSIEYSFSNYTRHTEREAEIIPQLSGLLKLNDPQSPEFKIQVTDTAIGGYGAEHLAKILIGIKESEKAFRNQRWTVYLNLLHDKRDGTNTTRMTNIQDLSSEMLKFSVIKHEVPNLLTEDYDGGLGLVFKDHKIYPCHEEGSFIIETAAGLSLVESQDLKITFDEFTSQAITDGLITSPDFKQEGDIWNKGRDK